MTSFSHLLWSLSIRNDRATLAAPPSGGFGCGVEWISNSGWRVACSMWQVAGGGQQAVYGGQIMTSVDIIV